MAWRALHTEQQKNKRFYILLNSLEKFNHDKEFNWQKLQVRYATLNFQHIAIAIGGDTKKIIINGIWESENHGKGKSV